MYSPSFRRVSLEAQNDTAPTQRTISVSGTAEKSLPADQVRISVQIKSVRNELPEAQANSQAAFSAIVEKLGDLGIKPDKIQLRDHELGKEYQTGRDGVRTQQGFYSTRDFLIELDDASRLEAVHQELAQNPDVVVNGTSYNRKDEIEIRRELRKTALIAAREKAVEMAAVYGQKIGKPLKVNEGGGFSPSNFNTRNAISFDPSDETRGRVTLSSQVEVEFELVD